MSSFASGSDMIIRYDTRLLAELLSDSGTPVVDLPNDATLNALLADASGIVLAYANRGGRYVESDLVALTGNSKNYLTKLVCDLTLYALLNRRGKSLEPYKQTQWAVEQLKAIELGHEVFGVPANIAAGTAETDPVPLQVVWNQNFITDRLRYFPLYQPVAGQI